MLNLEKTTIPLNKAVLIMGGWGLLLLLAGAMTQWFGLNANNTLLLWGGVTLLGIIAQVVSMVRGLGLNLGVWLALMLVGWIFTFYVTKFDNGAHVDLYLDLHAVWLILLGLGYVATAFQVDRRFLIIAAIHILTGAIMELSARAILPVDFLDANASLIVGLVGGLPLLVACLPVWYAPAKRPAPVPPVTTDSPTIRL